MIAILSFFVFSFLTSFLLTQQFRKYAQRHNLLDKPGPRSSHYAITPRGGGLSFVIVWNLLMLAGSAGGFLPLELLKIVLPGSTIVAGIGFIDDHHRLPSKIRFTAHLLAALMLVFALKDINFLRFEIFEIEWWPFGSLLALIGVIWSVNLFNFMDGIDTIASAEAICVFTVGGIFFWLAGGKMEAVSLWLLAASVSGFLVWNLPPAKIFMGDTGSYFLGFLIVAYALLGEMKYHISIILWLILYGIFWFDATVTLIRRIIKKEKWDRAHRSHAYQRLHQWGWSHGKVSAGMACFNMILICLAVGSYFHPLWIPRAFLIAIILMTTAYGWIEHLFPMKSAGKKFYDYGRSG